MEILLHRQNGLNHWPLVSEFSHQLPLRVGRRELKASILQMCGYLLWPLPAHLTGLGAPSSQTVSTSSGIVERLLYK